MLEKQEVWHYVAPLDSVPPGGKRCFEIAGISIIICRIYNDLFAVRDLCPHLGESLAEGRLQEYELVCPHHGASFDIRGGQPMSGPAFTPVQTYQCQLRDDDIYVLTEPQNPSKPDARSIPIS